MSGEDALGQPKNFRHSLAPIDSPPSFWTHVKMLIWRDVKNVGRDKSVTLARVIQSASMALLIGTIFHSVGSTSTASATNLQSQFGAIVLVSCTVMMGPAQAALLAFPEERPVFLREYTTKHYSVTAYFLSRLAVEAVLTGVQTFIIVSRLVLPLSVSMYDFLTRTAQIARSWGSRST
jgi:hypothetical protein